MGLISEDLLRQRDYKDYEGDTFQLILYSLALGLQAKLVYEVGVGQSTLAFLRAVQRTGGKVVSCDTNPDIVRWIPNELRAWWSFFNLNSEELRQTLEDQAELAFFDGCHSLSCIAWEVENYWPLVKVEGMMVLHDTRDWPAGPGVVLKRLTRLGLEVVEIPFSGGLAIIHKRASDPERLELGL